MCYHPKCLDEACDVPLGTCHCGCGRVTNTAPREGQGGYKKGEHYRYLRGHSGRKSPDPYVENEDGCWIWQGAVNSKGYGSMRVGRATKRAHRVYYERHVGEIPEGMVICHGCDVPLCVNPAHLFAGTMMDNMRDRDSKGRGGTARGSENRNAKLNEAQVREIRAAIAQGHDVRELGSRYGVSTHTIIDIRRSRSWKHVA